MKKAVVNIVKDLVSELTFNETINSCEVVDSRLELTVANTHGLVVNGKITIGDDTYTALKVEDNTITVSGNSCPSDLYLTILPPTYIHGTVKAASSELTQIKKSYSRFQIVYLYEVIQETRNRNPALSLDRSVEVVMFFLTSAKMKGELTDDKYSEYINQMDSLAEDFISVLESSPLIGSIDEDDYTIIPHSIAGFYDRIGHVKNLFNESYSGVELRVKLPINKSTCDKEDGTFVIPSFVRVYNSDETYDVNVKNGNELGLPDIDFTDSDGTTTSVPSMEDVVATPSIPIYDNVLFWLNGIIDGNEFVDVSGNGRNFTIIDKDFTTNYFPYKSVAKISAPIGDVTLIAADVNNFLYTAGVPNEIPVVSFFQNIDFEGNLFCRHTNQIVDASGAELSEPYINLVVMYDAPLTGNDLAYANAYYNVPEKEVVKWVSKDGSDSNAGTETLPYLTIVKGYSNAGIGGKSYIESGVYSEYIYNTSSNKIEGIGLVDYSSTNTAYGFRMRYVGTDLLRRFIIRAATIVTATIRGQSSTALEAKDLYIESNAINVLTGDYKLFKNCVFKGSNSSHTLNNSGGAQERTIETCLFVNDSVDIVYQPNGLGNLIFRNNKVNADTDRIFWFLNTVNGAEIYGNNLTVLDGSYYIFTNGDVGLIDIQKNTFTIKSTTNESIKFTDALTNLHIISNNNFYIEDDVDNTIIGLEDSQIEIENNIFTLDGEVIANSEVLSQITKTGSYPVFKANNNRIESKRTGGYNIGVGSEGTNAGDNDVALIEIKNNYIKGRHAYPSPTTNTVHSKFVGFQINADVKHNFTDGAGYSAVLKGSTGTVYTAKGFTYNIEKEFKRGVYIKGAQSVNIYNNTFFSDSITPDYSIRLSDNTGGDAASNCEVKNNIFVYLGSGTYQPIQILNGGTGNDCDYNFYYCPNGTLEFQNSNGVRTFAEWQSDGFGVNSKILTDNEYNNLFTDVSNDDFSINVMPYSGEDLGLDYDDGLDSATNWGVTGVIPAVVTKQQNTNWDVGAYIK